MISCPYTISCNGNAMIPWMSVSRKSIFTCELVIPGTIDIDKIHQWLTLNNTREISIHESNTNSEIFYIVNFVTDNENLVLQIQNRCRDKISGIFEQQEKNNEELLSQIQRLSEELADLRSKRNFQEDVIGSIKAKNLELRGQISRLEELKENDQELLIRNREDGEFGQSKCPENISLLETNLNRINGKAKSIPVEECLICGKQAMPGQGICLDCDR